MQVLHDDSCVVSEYTAYTRISLYQDWHKIVICLFMYPFHRCYPYPIGSIWSFLLYCEFDQIARGIYVHSHNYVCNETWYSRASTLVML